MSDTPETDANAGFAVTNKGLNYTEEIYIERDNKGPFVHANFARKLERERDELRAEVETLEIRHAAAMMHNQMVVDENTKLRAEVERAEAKTAAEYEAHKMTKCERDALRADVERLKAACEKEFESVQHLNDEVERLKADKARLDYIIIGTGIDRGKIDAQMKGAE